MRCEQCGIAKFPKCKTFEALSEAEQPEVPHREHSKKNGFSDSILSTKVSLAHLFSRFDEIFQLYIPHAIDRDHIEVWKEELLAKCESDATFAALFLDWSEKFKLVSPVSQTAGKYANLSLVVGVFVCQVDGKLQAKTFTALFDDGDNGFINTFLYLQTVLDKVKLQFPRVRQISFMSDGGKTHVSFCFFFLLT